MNSSNNIKETVYIFTSADFCEIPSESIIINKISKDINILWNYFVNEQEFEYVVEKINEQKMKGFVKRKFNTGLNSSCNFHNYNWKDKYETKEELYSLDLNIFSSNYTEKPLLLAEKPLLLVEKPLTLMEQFFDNIFAMDSDRIVEYNLNDDGTFVLRYETNDTFERYYSIKKHSIE